MVQLYYSSPDQITNVCSRHVFIDLLGSLSQRAYLVRIRKMHQWVLGQYSSLSL